MWPATDSVAAATFSEQVGRRWFALVAATQRPLTVCPGSLCAKDRLTRAGWSSVKKNVVPTGARRLVLVGAPLLLCVRHVECD